jgi:2-methylisocitrate lyase-like PEP mutase family enzyme
MKIIMLGTAENLNWLDAVAAARDVAQLEQLAGQAVIFGVWLQHEAGRAPAAAVRDQRPAMEVSWTAASIPASKQLYYYCSRPYRQLDEGLPQIVSAMHSHMLI